MKGIIGFAPRSPHRSTASFAMTPTEEVVDAGTVPPSSGFYSSVTAHCLFDINIFPNPIDKVRGGCYDRAMRWKKSEKKKRNQKLLDFADKHPSYTQAAIAQIFHLSRSRVTRILARERKIALVPLVTGQGKRGKTI